MVTCPGPGPRPMMVAAPPRSGPVMVPCDGLGPRPMMVTARPCPMMGRLVAVDIVAVAVGVD
eukprot:2125484-Pyramimonas_sp.AAC.1